MASKNPKNSDTIRIWSNDPADMLIELWSDETIWFKFALENSKTSGNLNKRGIQYATGKQNILLDSVRQYACFERF